MVNCLIGFEFAIDPIRDKALELWGIISTIQTKVKSVKPEHIDFTVLPPPTIEEILDEESIPSHIPDETAPVFDTKEDIWNSYEPMVTDVSTYLLSDEDVLIEYAPDATVMCIIENVSFNAPLTQDETLKREQWQVKWSRKRSLLKN
jgi:hypothetical protein